MSDPVIVDLAADTWVKVATAVYVGRIYKVDTTGKIMYTYRETPGSPPGPGDISNIEVMVGPKCDIRHSTPIDVYLRSIGKKGKVGIKL